jgi:release factor glutamine methyltransferase
LLPSHRATVVNRLRAAGCVFAEDEADLLISSAGTRRRLASMMARRVSGLPLEHVLGWAEFCGIRVPVDPGVFVPRRRTELLVREAALAAGPGATIVDLCCGSGAVGLVLATAVEQITLYGVDLDPAAARCARRNVKAVGGRVFRGDLYDPLPRTLRHRVDVIVANVPYVPSEAVALMPPEARIHEPRVALDGGPDGLAVQRRVAAGAADWLTPGGHVLLETSAEQSDGSLDVLVRSGLTVRLARDDTLDAAVVIGRAA